MSRSGYGDDSDGDYPVALWRGAVASAARGDRGLAFLREMLDILDAMPVKRLVPNSFVQADGEVCALGSVAVKRGLDVKPLELYASDDCEVPSSLLERTFGIAGPLAREIMYTNDDEPWNLTRPETPEERYTRVRQWVADQIVEAEAARAKARERRAARLKLKETTQ